MTLAAILLALQVVAVPTVDRLGITVWAMSIESARLYTVDVAVVTEQGQTTVASKQPMVCEASPQPLWFNCTLAIPTLAVGPHMLRFRTWETLYGRELPSPWSEPFAVEVFVREAPRAMRIEIGVIPV